MLIVGYCFGIRSERRLCEEVHLNLAYRWFCRLGLDGDVPDHSTFSKNRHGRFRESDFLRRVFETVLQRCIVEGLVGGEAFAIDASLIKADANRQKGIEGEKGLQPEATGRAVKEYMAVLDDEAFGAATDVVEEAVITLPAGTEGHALDLTDERAVKAFFAELGPFDHLAFTAGETLQLGPLAEIDIVAARDFFALRYLGRLYGGQMVMATSDRAAQSCLPLVLQACGLMPAGRSAPASARRWKA
jgi:hypothetical protein